MKLKPSQIKGRDGSTPDGHVIAMTVTIKTSPVVSSKPQLASATTRCDQCGTSDAISGRPGTFVRSLTCRSCGNVCIVNGGRGYRFEVKN